MKILVGTERGSYTFDANAKTVTITGLNTLELEQVLLITNITDNIIIYNFADPSLGGIIVDNVITLNYDTTLMDNNDRLQIFIEYDTGFDYLIKWISKNSFDKGSYTNTQIVGVGESAIVQLEENADVSSDILYDDVANYIYSDGNKITVDEDNNNKAKLKVQSGSINSGNFPYTTPGNYIFEGSKIEVAGGKAALKNTKITDCHDWPYTTIGNYTISPIDTIDIIAGKAKLHDKGPIEQNDNIDYNTSVNYIYDSGKIELVDKGGGNKAVRLKAADSFSIYAHWHLNEAGGVDVGDSSGNGRDGITVNMEDGDWVAGKLNNALVFDGTNEYVNCGNIANFERTDPFSVEFWIYKTGTGDYCYVSHSGASAVGWMVYTTSTNHVIFQLKDISSNRLTVRTNTAITNDVWHHVVCTKDNGHTSSSINIYINSVKQNLTTLFDALSSSIKITTDFNIGAFLNGTLYRLAGKMDEVVIYDQVLTQTDVDYRYNSGNGIEAMPSDYPTDDSTITSNFDSAFGTVLQWKDFGETGDTPLGTELKYNVSINSGVSWLWWDGGAWSVADGTYAKANTAVEIDAQISTLGIGNETIRVKAFLHSDGTNTPELDNILVIWYEKLVEFETDGRITTDIELNKTPETMWSWDAFVETVVEPANTEIRHVLSNDNGITWLYWNGGAWSVSNGETWAQFSTGADVTANIGSFLTTNARMKLRSYLKTIDTTVSPELNNIEIQYQYGYNYVIDNPDIKALFNLTPILLESWDSFVEIATKPVNTEIKYVLSNDDGVNYKYWDGIDWVNSDMQYIHTNTASEVHANISSFPTGIKKLRISVFLHTLDSTERPELDNVLVGWTETLPTFSTDDNLYIDTKDTSQISPATIFAWMAAIITNSKPVNTDIRLMFSIDGKVSWLTWDGGAWIAPVSVTTRTDATSIVDAVNNFGSLSLGDGTLDIRLFLYSSDNTISPDVSNINIESDTGFVLTGDYESNEYNSGYYSLEWKTTIFNVTIPIGVTLSLRVRAGNESGNLGSYSNVLTNGQETNMVGRYLQWKAEFTSLGLNTAEIDSIGFHMLSPIKTEVQP